MKEKTLVLILNGLSEFMRVAAFKEASARLEKMGYSWGGLDVGGLCCNSTIIYVNHSLGQGDGKFLMYDSHQTITPSKFEIQSFYTGSINEFLKEAGNLINPPKYEIVYRGVDVTLTLEGVILDPSKLLKDVEAWAQGERTRRLLNK